MGGCPIIWTSKLHKEIALSTLEANYIALSTAMRDFLPTRKLLQEIGSQMSLEFSLPSILRSTVFEENNGALQLAKAPKISPRTKHIAVKYHFFKDKIGEEKGIVIEKVDSVDQLADLFTKGLQIQLFKPLRKRLVGW